MARTPEEEAEMRALIAEQAEDMAHGDKVKPQVFRLRRQRWTPERGYEDDEN